MLSLPLLFFTGRGLLSPPLMWHDILQRLQMDLCSIVGFHGLQGYRCLTMGCTRGCREISAPVPEAPPVSCLLHWHGFLQRTFPCIFILFFLPAVVVQILPFPIFVVPKMLHHHYGFVQQWVCLRAGWCLLYSNTREASVSFSKKPLIVPPPPP